MATHPKSISKSRKNSANAGSNRPLPADANLPQQTTPGGTVNGPLPTSTGAPGQPGSPKIVRSGPPPPPMPRAANAPPVPNPSARPASKPLKLKTAQKSLVLADAGELGIDTASLRRDPERITQKLNADIAATGASSFLQSHVAAKNLVKLPAIAQGVDLSDSDREVLESLEKLIVTSEVKHGALAKTLWSFADTVVNLGKKDDADLRRSGLLARILLIQVRALFEAGAGKEHEDAWNGTLSDYKEKLSSAMHALVAAAQAHEDGERKKRLAALTTDLVDKSVTEQTFTTVFKDLTSDRLSAAEKAQVEPLLTGLLKRVADDSGAALWLKDNSPEIFVELVSAANKLTVAGKLAAADLRKLYEGLDETLQAKLLVANADRPAAQLDTDFGAWIWNTTTKGIWTKKEAGIAAQVYNALWNAPNYPDKYETIAKLVSRGGTSQAFDLGRDLGRGKREGEWSGFIQPLEHLLGNYVKSVHDQTRGVPGKGDPEKIDGAARILKAIAETYAQRGDKAGAYTPVLTDYERILKSEWLTAFEKSPGTIWGFEDVRLPYVQAGHDATFNSNPVGKRVLRMMELWDAVNLAIGPAAYSELLSDPGRSIDSFIKVAQEGIKTDTAGGKVGSLKDDADFMANWKEQVESYLRFLSGRTPKARFDLDELRGKEMGKSMGALACKAGLHWAKKRNEKLYYVLDGINMDDALDYRGYATAQINAWLQRKAPTGQEASKRHVPVITFHEIREILKNWGELKDTVVFVRQGKIQTGPEFESELKAWVDRVKQKGPERLYPALSDFPQRFKTELKELVGSHGVAQLAKAEPKTALHLLSEARMLKYALSMPETAVTASVLKNNVASLEKVGAISNTLSPSVDVITDRTKPADEQMQAVENFRRALENMPSESLKRALSDWLLRMNAAPQGTVPGKVL